MSDVESWGEEARQSASSALGEVIELCEECWQLRLSKKAAEENTAEIASELSRKETALKRLMEEAGVETIAGKSCVYNITTEKGIKAPQDIEGWIAFGEYIKTEYGEKTYQGMFRAHHATAAAFIKKELEQKGDNLLIPGVPPAQEYKLIKAKKKR